MASPQNDQPQELTAHLEELRNRIIRILAMIMIGWIIAFSYFWSFYHIISKPLEEPLRKYHSETVFLHLADPFMLKLKLSFVMGLLITAPYLLHQIWRFIAPGLTQTERKAVRMFIPASSLLFVCGVVIGYLMLPAGINWFMSYLTDFGSVKLMQNPLNYAILVVKILLAFGIAFQLPVVLVVLSLVGLVTSERLTSYWRYAIVIIFLIAALITPTQDPLSMTVLATPMVLLYFVTISVVKRIEHIKARRLTKAR